MNTLSALEERFTKPKGWLWKEFTNARGHAIRAANAPAHDAKAHVVYVTGLSEYAEKTFELARDFNKASISFSTIDRMGQGRSKRYIENATDKQHSEDIDRDIDDIIQFCRENIPAGEPIYLFGHSTGGLIATLAIEKAPELFSGAILTAPLYGIKAPKPLAGSEPLIARLPLPLCLKEKYVPGGKDWTPRSQEKRASFSSDPVRREIHDFWMYENKFLRTGDTTIGWVQEMCKGIARLLRKDVASQIKKPFLIFTGGKDTLINNEQASKIIEHLPHATHVHFEDGKHELLMEANKIRTPIIEQSIAFINNPIR